ncbi:hypothetical protein HXX01_02230 [Candidatus Nomurabacteria bacterium]|nr:hypothetical protein [Candidatus Nomurabacteria bacterium]
MKTSKKKVIKKKKEIVLCSSAAFYKQVIEVENELKKLGFRVTMPLTAGRMKKSGDFNVENYKTWYKDANDYKKKTFLTRHHFNKVTKGDYILVLNYEKNGMPGYIGGAVLSEMALALHFKKKIYILNPIPKGLSYEEELYGMLPIILNGDLSLIK